MKKEKDNMTDGVPFYGEIQGVEADPPDGSTLNVGEAIMFRVVVHNNGPYEYQGVKASLFNMLTGERVTSEARILRPDTTIYIDLPYQVKTAGEQDLLFLGLTAEGDAFGPGKMLTYTVEGGGVLPVANFSYTLGVLSLTTKNLSTGATQYLWSFGDGNTSTEFEPVHTYAQAGTYTVTLLASNATSSDQEIKSVVISETPPPEGKSKLLLGLGAAAAGLGALILLATGKKKKTR